MNTIDLFTLSPVRSNHFIDLNICNWFRNGSNMEMGTWLLYITCKVFYYSNWSSLEVLQNRLVKLKMLCRTKNQLFKSTDCLKSVKIDFWSFALSIHKFCECILKKIINEFWIKLPISGALADITGSKYKWSRY